ncbi:MAG: Smr/MutS family protein [Bacteroidales bacterium]|nr:Smr/MutS family protein [Bacteroidales bacterium]
MNNIEQKLGFDRIRQMVTEHTTNALARQMVDAMDFSTDYDTLRHELQLTEEMRQIVLMESEFPQQDFIDLTPIFTHLRVGNTFIPLEALFDLKLSLRTIRECYYFLTAEEHIQYEALRNVAVEVELGYGGKASQLNVINSLLGQLIDDHGELYDNASPALAEIRRTKARKAAEVDAQVNSALARAKREGWAPEGAEVTIRDGRPVIPLLTTHRRKMRGLIQDESASHQTAFVEPSEVVELGNDLRELDFDERHEIQRILLTFSDRLRPLLPQLEEAYRFLARIDFLRAKARVAVELNAAVPLLHPEPRIEWLDARHPILYLQKKGGVVPFNLALSSSTSLTSSTSSTRDSRILIISGPNAGGKSVLLKAVGLIQYMLQCGMPVPLRPTSECGLFSSVFIDIGDQQSLDNDLSTYTSHLQNMKELLASANESTLFLLDELGGGTEPRSGCAIAEAVLEELYDKGAFGVVTTHYADLKLLADHMPGVVNGAMLFDTEHMRPLYRLNVGHPGSSFAFEIAESIGFPKDILDRAGEKVGREQLNFEHQLQQLELDKKEIEKKKEELRVADEFLSEVTLKYQRLSDNLQARRNEIIGGARREAQQILEGANRTVERTISDIKSAHAEKEATLQARARLAEATRENEDEIIRNEKLGIRNKAAANSSLLIPNSSLEQALPVTVGTIVRIDGEETFGQVVEIKGKKAVVESNSLRMTIPLDRLTGTAKQKLPTPKNSASQSLSHSATSYTSIYDEMNEKRAHFNPTLDLRGHRAEEALDLLHKFLDEAILLSEKEVRILHGKGYGILMQVIHQELKSIREVRSFHPEKVELGGVGVTIVQLR